ncbi:MAG: response regulator [bacterium]|nr:response regulator [bacterium]
MSPELSQTVLLVEDNDDIAEIEQRILQKLGLTVRRAGTVREAIALYNEEKPSLIVLDLNLPDVAGWQLIEYARQKGRVPPVIVASAQDDLLNRVNSSLYDVKAYLVKPINRQQLIEAVTAALQTEVARR